MQHPPLVAATGAFVRLQPSGQIRTKPKWTRCQKCFKLIKNKPGLVNERGGDLSPSAIGALCIEVRLQGLLSQGFSVSLARCCFPQSALPGKAIVHHLKPGVVVYLAGHVLSCATLSSR